MSNNGREHDSPPAKRSKPNAKHINVTTLSADRASSTPTTENAVPVAALGNVGASSNHKNPPSKPKVTSKCVNGMFTGQKIFILPAGIGKARTYLFKKQIQNNGGVVDSTPGAETTRIVVDEKMEMTRLCRILKTDAPPKGADVIKSIWLSACLKQSKLLSTSEYKIEPLKVKVEEVIPEKDIIDTPEGSMAPGDHKVKETTEAGSHYFKYKSKKRPHVDGSDIDSDYSVSSGEEDNQGAFDELTAAAAPKRAFPKGTWTCAQASGEIKVNHNKDVTDKLEALAKIYENTNDRWRALGYQKGISALKRYHKQISTFEEAKAIQGVGERLATKIWEIIESGELRKLDEISSSEDVQAINIFTKVWGAGAATARQWVALGYRNLDDIRMKAKLTRHQEIGLRYYDDLNDRMDREEAGRIADTVSGTVAALDPGLVCMPCGSYRRGKVTCGDVDVLITHPDGRSHAGVFVRLLDNLHKTGFLTDDLVTNEENGNQKKYMGVCRLPGQDSKYRRLDIIVVPYDEYACAVMYFTGSAHFNRSMRHLAGKMGMSLSEHSLNVGVVRSKGEKLNKGTPLPTPTEESIFKHFGLPYRTPDQRNH